MQKYVRTLAPEFNATVHVKGTLSMARLDDPASASTSFFICTGPAPSLDGKYTAFGKVIDGMASSTRWTRRQLTARRRGSAWKW